MRKKIFVFLTAAIFVFCKMSAQVASVMGHFSPSSSTLIGNASRIGYDCNDMSVYYVRYNDSSYFCSHFNYGYWSWFAPAVNSTKKRLPQDFVITDFKKYFSRVGYIGSYEGVGMFGYIYGYNNGYNSNFQIYKLPSVDCLLRTAEAHQQGSNAIISMKFFSIGEKAEAPNTQPGSYLLEHSWIGLTPYKYAMLSYHPLSNEYEIADDVITISDYVVFATRDTRSGYAPVNLRIADTSDVLSSTSAINNQWQFLLPDHKIIYGKIRLIVLNKEEFFMAYVFYNKKTDNYYLCVHLININDFVGGINSVVTHEIQIEKSCSDLTDMTFVETPPTVVALLNGADNSAFYHINPYSITDDASERFYFSAGNFYSIDTIPYDSFYDTFSYIAIGDSVVFLQKIPNSLTQSCLIFSKPKMLLQPTPDIDILEDPLDVEVGNPTLSQLSSPEVFFQGTRTCNVLNNK